MYYSPYSIDRDTELQSITRVCDNSRLLGKQQLMEEHELAFLKREKEEMEAQKKQAEAFQLSQLMQFLYSTEIVMSPQDEESTAYHHQYPTESFRCLLRKEMMSDPVAIVCGHSCERKSIQEIF